MNNQHTETLVYLRMYLNDTLVSISVESSNKYESDVQTSKFNPKIISFWQ